MPVTDQSLGLRERKKIRTHQAIRREAFRLLDANGYAATTVTVMAVYRPLDFLDAGMPLS